MKAILKLLFCSLRSEGKAHAFTMLGIVSNSALIMLHCIRIEALSSQAIDIGSFGFGTVLGCKHGFADNAFLQQAFSSAGILIASSLLIILATRFLALRCRQDMLRSLWRIGVSRPQLFCFLMLEALALAVLGCALGIVLGTVLFFRIWHCVFFMPKAALAFTACSIMAAALLASIPSALLAALGMPHRARGITFNAALRHAAAALAALCVMWLLCFAPAYSNDDRLRLFSCVGTALFATSLVCFILPSIFIAEKAFNPMISHCLGISQFMTRHCCTGDKWRSVSGILAISSGLGIFLALHIWAASMLNMFKAPDTIPNALVRFHHSLAGIEAWSCMQDCPFTSPHDIMDICVEQPRLAPSLAEEMKKANALGGNVIAIGVMAQQAWSQETFLRLPFLQGCRECAERCFRQGERVCVIPDTLAQNAHLKLDQCLMLESPYEDEPLPYRVVGIVRLPWSWLTKCSGLRIREARCDAVAFLPYEHVLCDFGALENEFFWFNSNAPHEQIDAYAKDCAELLGLLLYDGSDAFSGGTRWDSGLNEFLVQTSTRESLNTSLRKRADSVIDAMARLPLLALLLAGTSVACAIRTSVLSRKREFHIMRVLGADNFLIARSILAEALLLGLCACTLGTASALLYAVLANKLVDYAPIFGIISPPLYIPVAKLLPGYAATLVISALSCLMTFQKEWKGHL